MAKKEISDIHKKLDKIYDLSMVNNGDLKAVKEHLKTLNGKVLRNIKEIEKVRLEEEKQHDKCEKHFCVVEKKVNVTQDQIVFAKGAVYGLSFLTGILSLIVITKTLGFW